VKPSYHCRRKRRKGGREGGRGGREDGREGGREEKECMRNRAGKVMEGAM
jgi:hypothetical protein